MNVLGLGINPFCIKISIYRVSKESDCYKFQGNKILSKKTTPTTIKISRAISWNNPQTTPHNYDMS